MEINVEDYCFSYKLGGHYPEYNYSVDVETEEKLEFYGSGGYSVNWCDREGRHPWAEITLNFDLETLKYKVEMELESKDGRIHETGISAGVLNKNMSGDKVEEFLANVMDNLRYEVEEKA